MHPFFVCACLCLIYLWETSVKHHHNHNRRCCQYESNNHHQRMYHNQLTKQPHKKKDIEDINRAVATRQQKAEKAQRQKNR